MTRRLLAVLMALGVVAAACGNDSDDGETAEPATDDTTEETTDDGGATSGELPDIGTLQVGYIPILGFAPYFVAQEKGYFEEVGLDVELQQFVSGDPMIAPLSTGQLDIGGGEFGPAMMNAIDQGLDVQIVGALASQPQGLGAVPLLKSAGAEDIQTVADLEGRSVAVNVERGMAEYLLNEALEADGLSIDDVNLTNIPFPEMGGALERNAVDAAVLPHPLAGAALGEGFAEVLVEGDQIADPPNPQNGSIYFGQRLLEEENREVGIRFLEAYLKAARDLFGEGWAAQENVAAISTWTEVPPPAIEGGVPYFFEPDGVLNEASLEDIGAYHVGRGSTELDEPLPLDEVIVPSFLDEALSRTGQFEEQQ